MANIAVIIDADAERRRAFLIAVRAAIAPIQGLSVQQASLGDFAAVWAAQPRAPLSLRTAAPGDGREDPDDGQSAVAIVWGDAVSDAGPRRIQGADLLRLWEPHASAAPTAFDGFHAALRYHSCDGLRFGADVLGLFPLYYASRAEVLLAGTSPELFRHHPCFPPVLDPVGLAGILLLHGLPPGRALLSGVRRLAPGHVLEWRVGDGARELMQYTIPESQTAAPGSFEDHVREVDEVFADAVTRHVPPGERMGLLLSGGRDSRQLAGYLHERDVPLIALSLGSEEDYEVQCARAVARALGCEHCTRELGAPEFVQGAIHQARWEHLGTGFSSIHMWGAIAPLRELPVRFMSGHLRAVRELEPLAVPSEGRLPDEFRRGIDAARLRRLLRPDAFGHALEEISSRTLAAYDACSAFIEQRPWRWYLAHGSRSHAGAVPWRLSFGSWPVLPILDRRVLAVMFALPDSSLANRRAQDAILRRRFPALARLPLDRNSHDLLPLLPTPGQRVLHRIRRAAVRLRRRLPRDRERRYYHRIYDINGREWRAVRELAEPHRERLEGLMNMDVLSAMVPTPATHIRVEHGVRDTFGPKLLIGLMLWSADHLQ